MENMYELIGDKDMIKIKVLQEFLRDSCSKTNSEDLVSLDKLVSQYNEVLLDSPYMTLSKPYEISSLSVNNNRKDFDFPYCDKDSPGTVYKGVLSDIFRFLEDVELYFWDPYAFKFGTGWFVPVNYSKNKEFDPETIISAVKPTGLITSAKPVSYEKEHNRVLGRFEYVLGSDSVLYYIGSYRASGFFRNYAAMLINRKLDLNNTDKSRTLVNTVLKSQELSDFVEVLKYYYDLGYKKVYCYDIFSALGLISEGSVSTYCRNLPNRNYRGESIMNNKVLGENIFYTTEIFLKCLVEINKEYKIEKEEFRNH